MGFLLRRNAHLLSEREQSWWSSCDIGTLVTLLSSLIYSHLEEQGCHQQMEARWEDGKAQRFSSITSMPLPLSSHSFLPFSTRQFMLI